MDTLLPIYLVLGLSNILCARLLLKTGRLGKWIAISDFNRLASLWVVGCAYFGQGHLMEVLIRSWYWVSEFLSVFTWIAYLLVNLFLSYGHLTESLRLSNSLIPPTCICTLSCSTTNVSLEHFISILLHSMTNVSLEHFIRCKADYIDLSWTRIGRSRCPFCLSSIIYTLTINNFAFASKGPSGPHKKVASLLDEQYNNR